MRKPMGVIARDTPEQVLEVGDPSGQRGAHHVVPFASRRRNSGTGCVTEA
jgi:hypothetical protein